MHVIVDGSNLATEGRVLPSLEQLSQAVIDFKSEHPDAVVTVIVDATFGHRIEAKERPAYEEGIVHQELVAPPAGAIGRGDAFVLRIAQKVGGVVLSNDSFQEFHDEHTWLFEEGRLIGGKPVPGVGWVFTPRTPVRGPKSRNGSPKGRQKRSAVTAEAPLISGQELLEKGRKAARPAQAPKKAPKTEKEAAKAKRSGAQRASSEVKQVENAIAVATTEATQVNGKQNKKKRRKPAPPAEPVNEPGVFLRFVANHRPGDTVTGQVDAFSSHGAFVLVDEARCYIPIALMGDPPPRAARDVLSRGEDREFLVRAFDPARRGIELALPGTAAPEGHVTEDTVLAETGGDPVEPEPEVASEAPAAEAVEPPKKAAKKAAKAVTKKAEKSEKKAPAKKVAKKAVKAAKKAPAIKKAKQAEPAKKAPAKKAEPAKQKVTKKADAKKTVKERVTDKAVKKTPAKKAAVKKAPAKKAAVKKPRS